jgi:hypothetical protein
MTLSGYYKKAIFYPSIIIILFTIVFSIIDNYDYKSEWLTADSAISLSILTALFYCLIVSLLSLTIFLNKFKKIKESKTLTFLCWFLLPFGFITIVFIHEINFKLKYQEKFGDDFVYVIILNIPFVLGIIWSYLKYRKMNCGQK